MKKYGIKYEMKIYDILMRDNRRDTVISVQLLHLLQTEHPTTCKQTNHQEHLQGGLSMKPDHMVSSDSRVSSTSRFEPTTWAAAEHVKKKITKISL